MKESLKKLKNIVENNFCCGCGVCVSVCPNDCIKMVFNNEIFLPNVINFEKCIDCGLCCKVCSKNTDNQSSEEINAKKFNAQSKHNIYTGKYKDSFVGYSEEERLNAASGGLLTHVLKEILVKGVVDYIITVVPEKGVTPPFVFKKFNNINDLASCSGSVYCPVEISSELKSIIKSNNSYAIVGLPCLLNSISLAQKQIPSLNYNIKLLLGLTCGQNKKWSFTEFINNKFCSSKPFLSVKYRDKTDTDLFSNFKFRFNKKNDIESVSFKDFAKYWSNDFMQIPSCRYCDDVFSEVADAVFMDAWLPEYLSEPKGTSFCISRSPEISEIFSKCKTVKTVKIEDVIRSQYGVIEKKFYSAKRAEKEKKIYWNNKYKKEKRKTTKQSFLQEYLRDTIDDARLKISRMTLQDAELVDKEINKIRVLNNISKFLNRMRSLIKVICLKRKKY